MQLASLVQITTACLLCWIRQTSTYFSELKSCLRNREMPVWWRAEALKKVTQGCTLNPDGPGCWNHVDPICLSSPCAYPGMDPHWHGGVGGWSDKSLKEKNQKKPQQTTSLFFIRKEAASSTGDHMKSLGRQQRTNTNWGGMRKADRWCKGIGRVSCSDFQDTYFSVNKNVLFLVNPHISESGISSYSFVVLARPNEDFGEIWYHTESLSAEVMGLYQ